MAQSVEYTSVSRYSWTNKWDVVFSVQFCHLPWHQDTGYTEFY